MSNVHHLPVRNDDPDTSHAAAAKAVKRRPRVRDAVYLVLSEEGPLTHDDLVAAYGRRSMMVEGWPTASASSIRTRCAELADDGLVDHETLDGVSRMGNRARLWRVIVPQAGR